jgi:hypothetical protein
MLGCHKEIDEREKPDNMDGLPRRWPQVANDLLPSAEKLRKQVEERRNMKIFTNWPTQLRGRDESLTKMKTFLLGLPARWKNSLLILPLLVAGFAVPAVLHGAAITWGPANPIAGDSDVITDGTLVYAYAWSGIYSTVNGVSFTGSGGINGGADVLAPAFFDYGPSFFTSSSTPFSALSTNYNNILVGADYTAGGSPFSVPVTLANLTIGHKYAVQVWVNDPRGPENARTETITSPGGNTNTLKFSTNTLMNPGGPGQYTVGTFTADGTNQTFTLEGNPAADVTQMNTLQLRDVGTPTWSGINSAGAGAVKLIFKGPSGSHYTLLTTTNIATPINSWTPLPNGTGTFGGITITNIDSSATNKAQFYRIRLP